MLTKSQGHQIGYSLIATMGGFCLGTVLGWSSPAEKLYLSKTNWVSKHKLETITWASSIMPVGAACAVLPTPFLMERVGRKWGMVVMGCALALSWVYLACTWKLFPCTVTARFLCGFFGGGFCVIAPSYIGEISEPSIRGALGSCFQLLLVVGILVEFCLGFIESLLWMGIISAIIAAIMVVLIILLLPESPVYLIQKNASDEKIDKVFRKIRGSDFAAEKESLKQAIAEAEAKKAEGVWSKFLLKTNLKAFGLTWMLMFAQQLSGINVVIFFAESIFSQVNSKLSATMQSVILSLVQVAATIISVLLVDRAGRKVLLLLSFGVMALCLFLLGTAFFKFNIGGWGNLALACVNLYLVGFSLGAGPLPWAMLGEMFAPEIKSVAGSICSCTNWILAFIVTQTFKPLAGALHSHGAYWFFAVICTIFFILIALFSLETKGKTLQQIQDDLTGPPKLFVFK